MLYPHKHSQFFLKLKIVNAFTRKLLVLFSCIISMQVVEAQSVNIIRSGGWFETAWVEWTPPTTSVQRYNVYYTGNGLNNILLDDQLIRSYGNYWRADVPGIAAGTYTIKVVPVISGIEADAATTSSLTVMAHDRSGFAFSNGVVPGAYKSDGTPKDGAVIIYITENTKNTVSINITGATSNPCVGLQTIIDGIKKGDDNRPFIFRMIGEITDLDYMLGGDIVIENSNNTNSYITLEGIGEDATANGWGIRLKNANNIEIRNIGIMNCNSDEGDDIGLQQNNFYVWVHNVDFFYGDAGSDSDQAKGDGALDSKKSSFVTHSFNHFFDSGKSNLLGNGGEAVGNFTYHHNWYDHSDSRHPRVREHTVHVYNNYFDGISKYGIGNTTAGSVFSENNYFRNCKYPMLISNQGTDVYGSNDGTFSGDPGGIIKAFGNYMEGETRFVDQNEFPTDFDAYVVTNKTDQVPSSVTTVSGGNTYNNFDTQSSMYTYNAESPENAKATCMQYAGRMNGGDFHWTFNNSVDDTEYAVNTALKAALVNYSTGLIYIQGDGEPPVLPPTAEITAPLSGSKSTINTTVTVTATASDPDGSVSNVVFYASLNGAVTTIGSDASTPYAVSWTPTVEGTYIVYAIATDDGGNTGTSAMDYAILIDDPVTNNAPAITSVSTPGSTFTEGSDITITTVAVDDNAVTKVEFYNGVSLLATATSEPFTYVMTSAVLGNYTITAIAYDAQGLTDEGSCSFDVVEQDESGMVHNFTISGLTSTYYTIVGNLSDSKGTETYDGLTLTQCLKIESATSISFSAAAEIELVLVFNIDAANGGSFAGGINIDGTSYTAVNGIVTVTLAPGSHTITKDDSANLYYMSAAYTGSTTYTLTVTQVTGGTIAPVTGTYTDGATVSVSATAATDYTFTNWTGDLSGSTNPTTITMNADKSISAIFTKNTEKSVHLNTGWNLVGCPIEGSTALSTAFSSIWEKLVSVKDDDNYYLINNPEYFNTLHTVDWGQGYLIKVSEPCDLTW